MIAVYNRTRLDRTQIMTRQEELEFVICNF